MHNRQRLLVLTTSIGFLTTTGIESGDYNGIEYGSFNIGMYSVKLGQMTTGGGWDPSFIFLNAFPSYCLSVIGTFNNGTNGEYYQYAPIICSMTTKGFTCAATNTGSSSDNEIPLYFNWIAIGY